MLRDLVVTKGLKKYHESVSALSRKKIIVRAVDRVDLKVKQGETLALVGESGCGKSTFGKVTLGLWKPTSGTVYFDGVDIFHTKNSDLRQLRAKMSLIFQDPSASINPRKSIRQILSQPYQVHEDLTRKELNEKISRLLAKIGLSPPNLYLDRYPHQFSGGQRQRIVIARAIALNPSYIVADEPVSSLDMSIRGQILNLMKQLQKDLKISYLLITHDLAVVRSVASRIAVMYLGKIVEKSETRELFENPLHPYTSALLSANPIPDPKLRKRTRIILKGDLPSPENPPTGCRFHTRCPYVESICKIEEPILETTESGGQVACHIHKHLPPLTLF